MRDMGIQAHPLATKAFKVEDDWGDNGAVIVWARNYFEAKREGAQALDMEYGDVECERFPKLDGFTGDLLQWMLDEGWYFSCQECEARCYSENIVRRSDDVFCSVEHADKFQAHWARKKAIEKESQRFAEVKYFGLDVRVSYVNVAGDAHVQARVHGTDRYEYGGFIDKSELDSPLTKPHQESTTHGHQ